MPTCSYVLRYLASRRLRLSGRDQSGVKMLKMTLLAAVWAATALPAQAQVQQLYNSQGDYAGTIMPSGPNAKAYYDADGNYGGTAMRAGRNTMLYDSNGNYRGMVTNSGHMFGDE